jgi:hypothetical protein
MLFEATQLAAAHFAKRPRVPDRTYNALRLGIYQREPIDDLERTARLGLRPTELPFALA